MTNRQLLDAPTSTLGSIQKQQRYVLKLALVKMECPACQTGASQVDALGGDLEAYTFGPERDYPKLMDSFVCPNCHRGLAYCVPFVGACFWRLKKPLGPRRDDE
jgi:rubredoxin